MNKKNNILDRIHPFYFVIPALLIYSIFFLVPIIINIGTAFTDWSAYSKEINFIGFQNFIDLVKTGEVLRVSKTTLLYTVTVVLLQNIFGFFLALAFEKKTAINNFIRGILFAPVVVSIIVWGFLFQTILHPNGLLNNLLSFISHNDTRIIWLGSTNFTIFAIAAVQIWIATGWTTMIYLAAINTVPEEVREAARIDGLGYFGMIKRIIIPLIIPGLTINLILSTINSLKVFDLIIVLTRGGPGGATEVFNTWIYDSFGRGLLGYASAQNLFLILLISIIAFPAYILLSKKVVEV